MRSPTDLPLHVSLHWPGMGLGELQPGQRLTAAAASGAPVLSWAPHHAPPGVGEAPFTRHTVLLFDPDAPSPVNPVMRSWLHWLVVNCAGGDAGSGREAVAYAGPSPPTGAHRYVALVCRQTGHGELSAAGVAPPSRGKFDVAAFCLRHALEPEGIAWWTTAAPGGA